MNGSKDRFAITTQRVSVWRMTREDIDKREKEGFVNDRIDIADITSSHRPMTLGSLEGNFFCLRLRADDRDDNVLVQTLQKVHESHIEKLSFREYFTAKLNAISHPSDNEGHHISFLNLFGPQRFGSPLPLNTYIGIRLVFVKLKWLLIISFIFFEFCLMSACLSVLIYQYRLSTDGFARDRKPTTLA